MNNFLMSLNFNEQIIYLAIVLIVLGEGLKGLSFIKKELIIFLLLIMSMCINFIFYKISAQTLFESIIATSLSVFIYDIIKQVKKLLK